MVLGVKVAQPSAFPSMMATTALPDVSAASAAVTVSSDVACTRQSAGVLLMACLSTADMEIVSTVWSGDSTYVPPVNVYEYPDERKNELCRVMLVSTMGGTMGSGNTIVMVPRVKSRAQ